MARGRCVHCCLALGYTWGYPRNELKQFDLHFIGDCGNYNTVQYNFKGEIIVDR